VQDRYAGDLGDYLKFGLLRWLVPLDSPASLRLGVVWYRTINEAHNADGKHTAYLQPGHRSSARLRPLDPDLHQRLASVVASGRRDTAALAGAGVLTRPGTREMAIGLFSPCMAALFVKIQVAERLRTKRHRMFRRARPPRRWLALRGLPRSQ